MRRTTVYLTDEEREALRRAAASTGRSQSELIREGIRLVTRGRTKRRFRSMGIGEGSGEPVGRNFEDYLAAELDLRQ